MATIENLYTGNGSTTDYSFTFPYLDTADIKTSLAGVASTAFTLLNATTVRFNSAPSNGIAIRIYRKTSDEALQATFYPGSAIRAEDLNENALQNLYVTQEANEAISTAWTTGDPTVISSESWYTTDDNKIASTKAIENRITAKIDTAIETDVLVGTDLAKSASGGQVTISHNVSGANTTVNNSNGEVLQDIAITGQGHVTSVGSVNLDGRYYTETELNAGQLDNRYYTETETGSLIDTKIDTALSNDVLAGQSITKSTSSGQVTISIANGAIDSDQLAADSVGASELADNSVASANIINGTIVDADIATGTLDNRYYTETELNAGQLDNRYYTETEVDANFYKLGSVGEITSGETWSAADNKVATTAAIDARITDLVDDVGGFVPIANETSFPAANPDVNNGAGTLVSVKALASNLTSNGSGVATISNGAGSGNTVTINGLANSTTYAATFGMIVETTSTLHTYTFHRLVPKATEVTTVSTNISNVNTVAGNNTNINTVAGANSNISTVATNISNVNNVGGSISNVNTVATNISNVNDFSDKYRVASSAPTSSLDTGDLYFDTSANELKVYNGSAWQGGVTATGNLASLGANTFTGSQSLGDNLKVQFGAGNDLQIYHDGSDSYLKDAGTGKLRLLTDSFRISNAADSENMVAAEENGAVSIFYDNSKKFETNSVGVAVTGSLSTTGYISLPDSANIYLGNGNDLQLYHTGSENIIKTMNGNIHFRYSGQEMIIAKPSGAVELYYDNSKKFYTHSGGAYCSGNLGASGELYLPDNGKLVCGTGDDLQMYHDGTHSYLTNTTGDLKITDTSAMILATNSLRLKNGASDENYIVADVNSDVALYYDNSKKVETYSNGLKVAGTNNVWIQDNGKLVCGGGSDLQIYHDGSNSLLTNSTGRLIVHVAGNESAIDMHPNGSVELYYDNSKKFETLSTGWGVPSTIEWHSTQGSLDLYDNKKISFGHSRDLQILHDGNDSYVSDQGTGSLKILSNAFKVLNAGANEAQIYANENGSVELYYDNSKKFHTTSGGVYVTGDLDTNGGAIVSNGGHIRTNSDSARFKAGSGNDLEIYHDGSNSYIVNGASGGNLYLQTYGENSVKAIANGAVELYHNGNKKLETTSTGIDVTGAITVNGAALGGGLSVADWYVHSQTTIDDGGSSNEGHLGGGNWTKMESASSSVTSVTSDAIGIFSFPSTGMYRIELSVDKLNNGSLRALIQKTTDNGSNWDNILYSEPWDSGGSSRFAVYFNCTNVSTHKVRMYLGRQSGSNQTAEGIASIIQKLN